MRSFQHLAPAFRLFAGRDCLGQLDRELNRHGASRAVIFCGGTLSRSPLVDLVRQAMGGRCAGVFAGVKAHSPLPAVEAGVAALRSFEADAVVAVGGGSAVVTARASAILLAETGTLEELATSIGPDGRLVSPRLAAPKLPQIVIPTTPATAAVKAGTAVFHPGRQARFALFDPKTRAESLFVHPDLLMSASAGLAVSAGLDTLSLAVEGLTSRTGSAMSDASLMHAVRLLAQRLPDPAVARDAEARADLMMAAILAGQGTDHTGAGMATVLGHAIGANHDVENGIAKTIVLPHVFAFNGDAAAAGLAKLGAALGLPGRPDSSAVAAALREALAPLALPASLRDVGVPREALPAIAERGMGDWFLRGNPRPVKEAAELMQVLEASW